jgi:hypothetical protein
MARNRKNQSAAIRFGPALKAILLCLFIGGSGIGYVWQKNQIDELGKQIKKRELRLSDLQRQNKLGRDTLALLRSPKRLIEQVKELKLGLGPPEPSQIQRLIELPPASESTNATERLYAERQAR